MAQSRNSAMRKSSQQKDFSSFTAANDNEPFINPVAANDNITLSQRKNQDDTSPTPRHIRRSVNRASSRKALVRRLLPEGDVARAIERVRATTIASSTGWMLVGIIGSIWIPIMFLWLIGVAALGSEAIPIANIVLPGGEVFAITYFIITPIWVVLTLITVFSFLLQGIDCFSGWKLLVFIVCFAAQLLIFLNFIPWILIWVFMVILSPVPKEPEAET